MLPNIRDKTSNGNIRVTGCHVLYLPGGVTANNHNLCGRPYFLYQRKNFLNKIKDLDKNGLIYESEGSIYFKIENFKSYGQLSNLDMTGMKTGVRIDVDEYDKENVKDFVLWKAKKEGEPSWDTE